MNYYICFYLLVAVCASKLDGMGNKESVQVLQTDNFDYAASVFDNAKPKNSKIAGLALVYRNSEYVWSVNYEVNYEGILPMPDVANITLARNEFIRVAPDDVMIRSVDLCIIKPGGLIIKKWQVSYLANL